MLDAPPAVVIMQTISSPAASATLEAISQTYQVEENFAIEASATAKFKVLNVLNPKRPLSAASLSVKQAVEIKITIEANALIPYSVNASVGKVNSKEANLSGQQNAYNP